MYNTAGYRGTSWSCWKIQSSYAKRNMSWNIDGIACPVADS